MPTPAQPHLTDEEDFAFFALVTKLGGGAANFVAEPAVCRPARRWNAARGGRSGRRVGER